MIVNRIVHCRDVYQHINKVTKTSLSLDILLRLEFRSQTNMAWSLLIYVFHTRPANVGVCKGDVHFIEFPECPNGV